MLGDSQNNEKTCKVAMKHTSLDAKSIICIRVHARVAKRIAKHRQIKQKHCVKRRGRNRWTRAAYKTKRISTIALVSHTRPLGKKIGRVRAQWHRFERFPSEKPNFHILQ